MSIKTRKEIKTFNTCRWHTIEPPANTSFLLQSLFYTNLFVKFFAWLFNRHYTVLKSECAIKRQRIFHQRWTSLKNQILAWYFVFHLVEHKVSVATTSAGSSLRNLEWNLKTTHIILATVVYKIIIAWYFSQPNISLESSKSKLRL